MEIVEKSRKIYINGATGLIGSSLYASLLESDYQPVVLTRSIAKARIILGDKVCAQYWNGNDTNALMQLINGSRAIINLSGESIASRWTKKKKIKILRSRVDTTNAIVEAIKQCSVPPEVYIQASATGYYPFSSNLSFDENGLQGDGFLSHVVQEWEQAASKVGDKSRLLIVRTGVVLSDRGGFLGKIILPIKLFVGGWFGSGAAVVSWIHLKDHIRAMIFLLENKKCSGIYNFTTAEPSTIKSIVMRVGKILNRPVWLPIPVFALRLVYGQMAKEVILSNQSIIPKRLVQAGFKFEFSSIDDALNDLLDDK